MTTHAVVEGSERSRISPLFRPDPELVAVACACGRTLVSATRRGLVAQVTIHWHLRHPEPVAISPKRFVERHAFLTSEDC